MAKVKTIAIAALLYFFWAFPYRAVLSYREQLQLFQTTDSYFAALASRPGGIATYIGEFLTQFFNNYWIGAGVMTALMLLFLLLCFLLNKKFSPSVSKATNFLLSLIPLIAVWLFYGNPDVTLNFLVALIMALGGAYYFTASTVTADPPSGTTAKSASEAPVKSTSGAITNSAYPTESYLTMVALTAFLYWLAGPTTIVFTLLTIGYICKPNNISLSGKAIFAGVSLLWFAANVCIWSFTLPYPLSYQLIGIGYRMTPDVLDAIQLIVEALCVLVPLVAFLVSQRSQKIAIPSLAVVELVAIVVLFPKAYDKTTYRLIDYDYMVRANNWDGILKYSDKHNPNLPLSVSATNLASGMTGQLDSRAFDYYQNGVEGLIPPFAKETLSSWTTGEIFFQLGLVNSAQRFYFEGMEAIPNYNKSSRAVKRLAETAIIRGDYPLARKYLLMLKNTTFYKKWAERNLQLIKDSAAVDNHPLYGLLRKRMVNEDYMFSEGELDKTLGQLYLKDPSNNLAKQYLVLYPLLQRDLNKFVQYMGVVAEAQPNYNPLLAQQALAFISMKNGQAIPSNMVPPMVEQSLRDFARAWTSKNASLIEPYRHTLYHYLLSDK